MEIFGALFTVGLGYVSVLCNSREAVYKQAETEAGISSINISCAGIVVRSCASLSPVKALSWGRLGEEAKAVKPL